jgi:hypothetical protein
MGKYQKNQPSIEVLESIGETTSDDDLTNSNLNLDNYLCMKYAPITLVDVE